MGDEEIRPEFQEAAGPRTRKHQFNVTGSSSGDLFI